MLPEYNRDLNNYLVPYTRFTTTDPRNIIVKTTKNGDHFTRSHCCSYFLREGFCYLVVKFRMSKISCVIVERYNRWSNAIGQKLQAHMHPLKQLFAVYFLALSLSIIMNFILSWDHVLHHIPFVKSSNVHVLGMKHRG